MYPFLKIASNTLIFSYEMKFYWGKKPVIILERDKELIAFRKT